MPPPPTAASITVAETLALLDSDFANVAQGVADGRVVLWLGSGISLNRVAGLRPLVERVLAFLHSRVDPADPACSFRKALGDAITLARLPSTVVGSIDVSAPPATWPPFDDLVGALVEHYSELLDVRIPGQPDDFMLWEGVDVVDTYASTPRPDAEHLCIAILATEGVLPEVVSANWDGLVEAAVESVAAQPEQILHPCVSADDFRAHGAQTRLLKFHGCAVKAGHDPSKYRPLIVARRSQIVSWSHAPEFALMRQKMEVLASERPTLMIGLSAQDYNIQAIFAAAERLMNWRWPDDKQSHVFAGSVLTPSHQTILRVVYHSDYSAHGSMIESEALLPVYASALLTALVLYVIAAKLKAAARLADAPLLTDDDYDRLQEGIQHLRDKVAVQAEPDRLMFIEKLLHVESRAVALFQDGREPAVTVYRPLTARSVSTVASDPALATSGVRELAVALSLLGLGAMSGEWDVVPCGAASAPGGVLAVESAGSHTTVVFAANAQAALRLEVEGVVDVRRRDVLLVHSTDPVQPKPRTPRRPPGRTGRARHREVAVNHLLANSADADDLMTQFRQVSGL